MLLGPRSRIVRHEAKRMYRHIHLKQDEFFVVDQGILAAEIDGKEYLLTKNDGVLPIYRNSR
jgi:uncharacterized cupin superfamily protein